LAAVGVASQHQVDGPAAQLLGGIRIV
jgi:hypothetical protein